MAGLLDQGRRDRLLEFGQHVVDQRVDLLHRLRFVVAFLGFVGELSLVCFV